MAPAIWSLDPAVGENQAFDCHRGEPTAERLGSGYVRVIVEGLAQVLSDKVRLGTRAAINFTS